MVLHGAIDITQPTPLPTVENIAENEPTPTVPAAPGAQDEANPGAQGPGVGALDFLGNPWVWATAAIVLLGVGLVMFLPVSPLNRSKRRPGNAGFYYRRMLFLSRLLRAGPAPHQTPYEFSESLSREVPGTSLFARTISRAYVREKFGKDSLDQAERRNVGNAYDSLRARLLRSMPGRQVRRILPKRK